MGYPERVTARATRLLAAFGFVVGACTSVAGLDDLRFEDDAGAGGSGADMAGAGGMAGAGAGQPTPCTEACAKCCDKGDGKGLVCVDSAENCPCDPNDASGTCDAAFPFCCDDGDPRCSSNKAGCSCDPDEPDCEDLLCCDKGSGFRCAGTDLGCFCNPADDTPCPDGSTCCDEGDSIPTCRSTTLGCFCDDAGASCEDAQTCCDDGSGAATCASSSGGCRCNVADGTPCSGGQTCCDEGKGEEPTCVSTPLGCLCDPLDPPAGCGFCCDKGDGIRCHATNLGCD